MKFLGARRRSGIGVPRSLMFVVEEIAPLLCVSSRPGIRAQVARKSCRGVSLARSEAGPRLRCPLRIGDFALKRTASPILCGRRDRVLIVMGMICNFGRICDRRRVTAIHIARAHRSAHPFERELEDATLVNTIDGWRLLSSFF